MTPLYWISCSYSFITDDKKNSKVISLTCCVKQLRYVYVWHAITGYWGGVRPGVAGMEHYESKMQQPVSSPGVQKNEPCDALDSITTNGLGLVNPEKVFSFYNELHSYLASAGIDGVKVDVQNILETLGAGHGGRVLLARKYQHEGSRWRTRGGVNSLF